MFDLNLVPTASANNAVQDAASAGAEAATNGLEGLVRYVVNNIDNWIAGIVVVFIFFILSKMAAKAIKETMISKKGEDIQEASLLLVERITVITITIIGITIALAINGLNFTAVVGALSLGVGFALKDIIGNFMSGVIMLSQDKFKIGHFIKTNEGMGRIVSIDTRATVLKAINGTEVVIPNQNMLNQSIVNFSINPFRRVELMTYVSWNSDLDKAIDVIHEVLNSNPDILRDPKSNVYLHNLEDDSNYVIRVLFWVETGKKWLKIRSDVHRGIIRAFEQNSIEIDYPVETLTLGPDELNLAQALGHRKQKRVLPAQNQEAMSTLADSENADVATTTPTVEMEIMPPEAIAEQMPQLEDQNTVEQSTMEQDTAESNVAPQNPIEIVPEAVVPEPQEFSTETDQRVPPPTHL